MTPQTLYNRDSLEAMINKVSLGDLLELIITLPDECLHCCVTSPPYWALRDYGKSVISHFPEITFELFGMPHTVGPWSGQIGHEPDPIMFTAHMVHIFRQVRRVLRKDGTLWMNFGDSYINKSIPGGGDPTIGKRNLGGSKYMKRPVPVYMKPKDKAGIPWMVAFALREDGWFLRQDIIWSKPNPMPESVNDRCTSSHEYIFLLSKSKNYFYDATAIKTEAKEESIIRAMKEGDHPYAWNRAIDGSMNDGRKGNGTNIRQQKKEERLKSLPVGQKNIRKARDKQRGHVLPHAGFNDRWDQLTTKEQMNMGANKRSVWEVATRPFTDAHFATYPQQLIIDCIKAGCPEFVCPECGSPMYPKYQKELVPTKKAAKTFVIDGRDGDADRQDQGSNRQKDGHKPGYVYQSQLDGYEQSCGCEFSDPVPGIVLEPFAGSNTTGIVSRKLHRNYISFEINPEYEPIYSKRINDELGLFK